MYMYIELAVVVFVLAIDETEIINVKFRVDILGVG